MHIHSPNLGENISSKNFLEVLQSVTYIAAVGYWFRLFRVNDCLLLLGFPANHSS
jgi:hypothetical protein